MANFTVGCLNVRGLQNKLKRKSLYKYIHKNCDIFMAQEVYASSTDALLWEKEWGGKLIISAGESNSKGVAIFISSKLNAKTLEYHVDSEGRYVILNIEVDDVKFTVSTLYAPNVDNPTFFNSYFEELYRVALDYIIIGGDYNLVLDTELDSAYRKGNNSKAQQIVKNTMEEQNLVDAWRLLHEKEKQYTLFKRKPKSMARLDFYLISDGLGQYVSRCDIEPAEFSDHNAVYLKVEMAKIERGPGLWKFNQLLLSNEEYVTKLTSLLKKWWLGAEHLYICERWEYIKNQIASFTKNYCKNGSHKKQERLDRLKTILAALDDERQRYLPMVKEDTMSIIQGKIRELEEEQAMGSIFRSKVQWVKDGERNTKYFFSLEKRNYNRKVMGKLNIDGDMCMERQRILNEQKRFYQELYTRDENIKFGLENETGIEINQGQRDMLNSDVMVSECHEALLQMKDGKTPGCDGIPAEFYKVFWSQLSPMLMENYVECLKIMKFNRTARHGIISLIPKGNKDPTLLRNWRPLTLLNLDYKILGKVFVNRLKKVLPDIIGHHQTGFMESREISENIRKTIDVISYVNSKKGRKCLIMTIDMEKCFDCIEYNAVYGALKYFGITGNFEQWIHIFFTEFSVQVQNAGFTTESFVKSRSVNQGCTISPYLYLICGELLAHKIKYNEKIKGIQIGEVTMLISQFADDTTLFLEYDEISLEEVVHTLTKIEANTGLKVSYDKTILYRVGSSIYHCQVIY